MKTTFDCVVIGQVFTCGGSIYIKQSSRTGKVAKGHPAYRDGLEKQKWFYFGQKETVLTKD